MPIWMYDLLQKYVNGNFSGNFNFFISNFQIGPNSTVLDIGCGTGLLAKLFSENKINYIGVDLDADRINIAKKRFPELNFFCQNLDDINFSTLPRIDAVILHGVIHHLNEVQIAALFKKLKDIGCKKIGLMDPILPEFFLFNPPGYVLAKMDQGMYVRKIQEYSTLLESHGVSNIKMVNKIHWPVPIALAYLQLKE